MSVETSKQQPRTRPALTIVSILAAIGTCSAVVNVFQGEDGALPSAIVFGLVAFIAWKFRKRRAAEEPPLASFDGQPAPVTAPAAPTAPVPGPVTVPAAPTAPVPGPVTVPAAPVTAPQAPVTAPPAAPKPGPAPAAEVPEGPHPMAEDPRSAWAYRRFLGGLDPHPLDRALAAAILDTLEPGDHIELIADAETWMNPRLDEVLPKPRPRKPDTIAVRTLRGWILVNRAKGKITAIPGRAAPGKAARTPDDLEWPKSGWAVELTPRGGWPRTVKLFLDRHDKVSFEIIETGAGPHIRRLPENPDVPPAPDPGTLSLHVRAVPSGLPADWKAAEEIARAHMRDIGFPDARLTGGGRDGGVDVASASAVAQVKMLALPVGAPPVQQLRGTRPELAHHLFYSTSGYTSAAQAAAAESGVSLFTIDASGAVEAVNDGARRLLRTGAGGGEASFEGPDVHEYARGVCDRVLAANAATDRNRAHHNEKYPGQWKHVAGYLIQALKNIDERPTTFESVQSGVIYYHHTELLAAVYYRELGIPYPGGAGDRVPDSLDDFYR
ncbi:restriction endonuclease [Actinoplanes sp. NPDC023936]|uniref:restriction endonuclease n=1 Tax=Actinoplanes sp. NPDC023936 TaxID=3154910 RepID=UPI0034080EC7